ncbi:unnamed protein product [Laminaria digitata]
MSGTGSTGGANTGILYRSLKRLFADLDKDLTSCARVHISYLQIYCETLQDLLDPSTSRDIVIREMSTGETFVEGLCRVHVDDAHSAMALLDQGGRHRAQASDGLNQSSSRSHAIALVYVERRCAEGAGSNPRGVLTQTCLMLADLAGSESSKRSSARYRRLEECKSLNLSLSALGNCVAALANVRPHVPYRDSKLTRLLQQSLGGNCGTALILTLLPGRDDFGETLSTLVFGQRAMSVTVKAHKNVVPDLEARCQELQQKLDLKSDELTHMTARKTAAEEASDIAKCQLAQVNVERSATEARFQATAEAFENRLHLLQSEDAASIARAMQCDWKEEMDRMETKYIREMQSLKQAYEERVKAHITEAASAGAECSSNQAELSREKEEHLAVMRELRVCQSKARKQERDTNNRISDLLSEVSEKDAFSDGLQAQIRVLEEQSRQHAVMLGKEYVSRQQVNKMEQLFQTAVEGLNNRLKEVETSKADSYQRGIAMARTEAVLGLGAKLPGAPGRPRSHVRGPTRAKRVDNKFIGIP